MPRLIKALLIDPYRGTITEVDHDADDYHNIYALLSGVGDPVKVGDPHTNPPHPVDTFEAFHANGKLPEGDAIFIDEEGRLKGPVAYFLFDGQPLAGRGLVLGSDDQGETQACKLTFDECANRVEFVAGEHDRPPAADEFKVFTFGKDGELKEVGAPEPKPEEQTYGADPKAATPEQRKEAREALRAMAVDATDDEFDEIGHVLSLGIEIERALRGIDMATDIADKLGARAVGAQMAITHKGHEYHVTIERCPSCEKAKAAAEPEPAPEGAE